jgi:hypothetical protein
MDTKTQFLSNQNLASWWGGIANDARFDQVLLHASGCALEGCPSEQERAGALKFKEILLTLSNADAEPVKFASPGLNHDLESVRRIAKPPETK